MDGQNGTDESRRAFFRRSGLALLAGYAFDGRSGLAQTISRPDSDRYQSVTVKTHEWFGDIDERLDFPKDWQVDVISMAGQKNPVLTDAQILRKLRSPIGAKPIRELAAGKKNAVVTFDDLVRPTPIEPVAKQVVAELNAAGIDDDHILLLCALGSHMPITSRDARAKLGELYFRCPWMNHNVWDELTEVGTSSFGNRIELDTYFHHADLRILIGGLRDHHQACYGGGAKSIIPGVVSVATIYHNHNVLCGLRGVSNPTVSRTSFTNNEMRTELLEAARMARVDFSINIVYNGHREILDVFAGDVNDAWIEACRYAVNTICDEREVNTGEYDIVVSNSYPCSQQRMTSFGRPREGGVGVVIAQSPLTYAPLHYYNQARAYNSGNTWWDRYNRPRRGGNAQLVALSRYMPKTNIINYPDAKVLPAWDQVLAILEPMFKGGARVAVFPYQGIAHTPKTLV